MRLPNTNQNMSALLNLSIAAVILAIGFFLGSLVSVSPTSAAGSTVGFIDIDSLLEMHPGWTPIMDKITAYETKELQKLEKYKGGNLTEEQKKESIDLALTIRENINAKRKELSKPLLDDILQKAKIIGRQIGVEVVLDGAIVLYGGVDLTSAVYDELEANL